MGDQCGSLSFAGRTNGDRYRVLAAYSNTVVSISGTVVTITNETINLYGPWLVSKTNETLVVTITNAGAFFETIWTGRRNFRPINPFKWRSSLMEQYFDTGTNTDG